MESNTFQAITSDLLKSHLEQTKDFLIIDTRPKFQILSGYIPTSISIFISPNFDAWVPMIIKKDQKFVIVCEKDQEKAIFERFSQINFSENLLGYLENGVQTWLDISPENKLVSHEQITPEQLAKIYKENKTNPKINIIDLRREAEFKDGYLDDVQHIPIQELQQRLNENKNLLDPEQTHYLFCRSGGRAALAQTILIRYGIRNTIYSGGLVDIIKANTDLPIKYL